VAVGGGYCPTHKLQHDADVEKRKQEYYKASDAKRESAHLRGYNYKWTKIRARKLRTDPICESCRMDGLYVNAEEVHHKDSNPFNNSWDNLESLCKPCHRRKRQGDRGV
jgi:HNH endonuclease.